jgi:hypothetical protein
MKVLASEKTATSGFNLTDEIDISKEVKTPKEFVLKFIDITERVLDIDPDQRDWQSFITPLMSDAEKVLG